MTEADDKQKKKRPPIPVTQQRKLALKSGKKCAFPKCKKNLIVDDVYVGEMAHICGFAPNSARHDPDMSKKERNEYDNLIFLCEEHHKIIDSLEKRDEYTVEALHEMRAGAAHKCTMHLWVNGLDFTSRPENTKDMTLLTLTRIWIRFSFCKR